MEQVSNLETMEVILDKQQNLDSSDLLQLALQHFLKKQYVQAQPHFKKLQARDQQNYLLFYYLAVIVEQQGQTSQAVTYFQSALKINPNHYQSHSLVGMAYKKLHLQIQAIRSFQMCIHLQPRNTNPYLMLGHLHRQNLQNQKALDYFLKVIELEQQCDDAYCAQYQAGLIYLQLQKYIQAVAYLQRAAEKNIGSLKTYLFLANQNLKVRKIMKVIEYFHRVIKIDSKNEEAFKLAGISVLLFKDCQFAIFCFKKCIELNPSSNNYFFLGVAYFITQNVTKAAENFRIANAVKENPLSYYCLALIYYFVQENQQLFDFYSNMARKTSGVIDKFQQCLGLAGSNRKRFAFSVEYFMLVIYENPSQQKLYTWLAIYLTNIHLTPDIKRIKILQSYILAKKQFRQSTDEIICYHIGKACLKQNKIEQSVKWYQKSIIINPFFTPSLFQLAETYSQIRQLQDAASLYRSILHFLPTFQMSHLLLARTLAKMEKDQEAIQEYKRASELNPNYPTIWFEMGYIYSKINEKKQAVDSYIRAFESFLRMPLYWIRKNQENQDVSQQIKTKQIKQKERVIQFLFYGQLAVSLSKVQKINEAIICFEKAKKYLKISKTYQQKKLEKQLMKNCVLLLMIGKHTE